MHNSEKTWQASTQPQRRLVSAMSDIRNSLRSIVYPGLDLHTRNRASLCKFWKRGPRDVLDAGSGNGYFSWLAYQSGARVLALNFDQGQVDKARQFFLEYKQAERSRLRFRQFNLYDLNSLDGSFDEIICYETLEHIKGDRDIVSHFFRLLKPSGQLHLCCPYSLHPTHKNSELDVSEKGGHVRAGYTIEDYRSLLEPAGFLIGDFAGIGSPSLCKADNLIRAVRMRFGDAIALPLLPFVLPFVWWSKFNPSVPFSLYVRAVKPDKAQS
jgi:SAM-dependent methyltransferase